MDQINTRILLDEPNLQNHCFWLRNAKFQKTKIFLTVEWGEAVRPCIHRWCQGVLSRLPNELEDYYTRVCVKNKKVNIDISQAPNKMWANAFSIYIFTQPAAFQCVFLWRKKHLKVYNMNGTIIHFKNQWNHCTYF